MPKIYTLNAHCKTRRPPRRAAALVLGIFTLSLLVPAPLRASSWNPTLLVNTEAFQIVHEGDSATDVELRFGDTLSEKIYWDRTNSEFRFTDDIRADGNITGSGTLTVSGDMKTKGNLHVRGTASGAVLYASSGINSSGAVIIKTPVTTSATLGGTGALVVMQRIELGTGAYMSASGAAILALDSPVQGAALNGPASRTPHIVFGYRGAFDTNLYRLTGSTLATDDALWVGGSLTMSGTIFHALPLSTVEGRLTLTSGTPVTTADVTGATTIYFAPYKGNRIYLYDGTRWRLYSFSELSLALGTLTSDLPYDVFLYANGATPTLESLAWTNGTTRATALATQNGVLVKSGAATRRYLGTFYTTSTTTTEDSVAKRFVWNYYNRAKRKLLKIESTSEWTYGTTTWRSLNNSTSNRVEIVVGWNEIGVQLAAKILVYTPVAGEYGILGIDVDGTSTNDADIIDIGITNVAATQQNASCDLNHYPSVGYHYYQATEYASTTTNVTFYGTNGLLYKYGIFGWVEG